jgi:hypothetical protein
VKLRRLREIFSANWFSAFEIKVFLTTKKLIGDPATEW